VLCLVISIVATVSDLTPRLCWNMLYSDTSTNEWPC